MKKSDYEYELPDHLIAQFPPAERRDARLMIVDRATETITHDWFKNLLEYLSPWDLMVFNNTKVIPARLMGQKLTGGKVEMLLERVTGSNTAIAHVKANKAPKPNTTIQLADSDVIVTVVGRRGRLFEIEFPPPGVQSIVDTAGQVPLPPYIKRQPELQDRSRYQTVYAVAEGAVAAPTAGLHFDDQMLEAIDRRGIQRTMVTLHVGSGTFQPVTTDDIRAHQMHSEWFSLSAGAADQIERQRRSTARVLAVGTTSVRALESASVSGTVTAVSGDTDIFIYPGYEFKVVDALLTNFHLPGSTLLMLVSALANQALIKRAYQEAVASEYRFFSYGDAMLIV